MALQGQWALERGEAVLVKTGALMCYQLTDSYERFNRFQGRLAQQADLAWLHEKLGLFLADFLDDARLDELPTTPNCLVSAAFQSTLLIFVNLSCKCAASS